MRHLQFPPAFIALLLQLAAFILALTGVRLFELKPEPIAFALTCGLIAAVFSCFTPLQRWWLIIQLAFAPALVVALNFNIPPHFFLFAFFVMLLVFWNTFRSQVPLYLSSVKVWQALETFLPQPEPGKSFTFIDMGSGLGGILIHLANVRTDGNYKGVESAPLPCLWSWLRIRWGGFHQCRVHWGDLWDCDLAQVDVAFAYLSPAPMEQLWNKAQAEMRPGTIFISSTFNVPGQSPIETVQVDDLHHSTLLVWRM